MMISAMLQPVEDASVAQWIVDSIHPFGQDIGSVVPPCFDAYARVFHPAGKGEGDEWTTVRWSDIAAANGKVIHPEMQFTSIVPRDCFDEPGLHSRGGQRGLWDWAPSEGELPEHLAVALAGALVSFTNTPEHCYFAYWNGWGDPKPMMPPPIDQREQEAQEQLYRSYRTGEVFKGTPREFRDVAVKFSIPGREYFLFEGAVSEVCTEWDGTGGGNLPTIWWPQDRAWCVAGDTDLDTTYVGGTRSCIDELINTASFEALEIRLSASIGTDALNSRD